MNITESKFELNRNGLKLVGAELRPEGNNLPIAIVSHGFLSCKKDVKGYAYKLAEWGYAAYCFDFIGGGPRIESDGELHEMTVLTEKSDLISVIDYVCGLPYTNEKNLTLMGFSQGGFVSAMTASELKSRVSKLVLFFPALCIPDDARKGKMLMFEFDTDNVPDIIPAGGLNLGGNYVRVAQAMGAYEEIKGYDGEVIIIHGDNDGAVPLSYSEKAKELYGEKCRLHVIKGGGHGFGEADDKLAMEFVEKFLRK